MIVFASGGAGKEEGGSGFLKLVEETKDGGVLKGEIVTVVSNHARGGVFYKARGAEITFRHSPMGRTKEDYQTLIEESGAKWVLLSGWLGRISGHDPKRTINIHPALDLDKFGGKGYHGHHVHEAVWAAFLRGEVTHTGVSMHFADNEYDSSKLIFFQRRIPISKAFKDAKGLGRVVNVVEHLWQAEITNRVIHEKIKWDGKDPRTIVGKDIG